MKHPKDLDTEPLNSNQMLLASGVTILTVIVTIVALQLAQSGDFAKRQQLRREALRTLTMPPSTQIR